MMNVRNEMMQTLIRRGIELEAQHHEVARPASRKST